MRQAFLIATLFCYACAPGNDTLPNDTGVDNPNNVTDSSTPQDSSNPNVSPNKINKPSLLIIAPDILFDELQRLAHWKSQTGIPAKTVTLSEALQKGEGPDQAAKLKDYIKQIWSEGTLEYVILGGDIAQMPYREVHAEADVPSEEVYLDDIVATDMYFADLDGDWDPDGDETYAELDDAADLLPDVSIGRLPIETKAEAKAVVDKTILYEKPSKTDYQEKVLFLGEYAGVGVYGSLGLETYILPILPTNIELTRLYENHEEYETAIPYNEPNFYEAMATGQSIAFMMGHGSDNTLGPLYEQEEIDAINNKERLGIYITTECNGAEFDVKDDDSSAEEFVGGNTGGVAYIGSTEFGVGFPSLLIVMTQLTTCFYGTGPTPIRLGACLKKVLREYSTQTSLHTKDNPDRWTQFVTVLLGDPSIPVWTATPQFVQLEVDGNGKCNHVQVSVTDSGDIPVSDAVVTAYVQGSLLFVEATDDQGNASFANDDCFYEEAVFTVSGKNLVPVTWSSTDSN